MTRGWGIISKWYSKFDLNFTWISFLSFLFTLSKWFIMKILMLMLICWHSWYSVWLLWKSVSILCIFLWFFFPFFYSTWINPLIHKKTIVLFFFPDHREFTEGVTTSEGGLWRERRGDKGLERLYQSQRQWNQGERLRNSTTQTDSQSVNTENLQSVILVQSVIIVIYVCVLFEWWCIPMLWFKSMVCLKDKVICTGKVN